MSTREGKEGKRERERQRESERGKEKDRKEKVVGRCSSADDDAARMSRGDR